MGRIIELEKARHNYISWSASRYYDHPDGEDLYGKLLFTTKATGGLGLVWGSAACTCEPYPRTLWTKLYRTWQFFFPAVTASFIFTTVTYFSTRFRGKDDEVNYILGGALAGSSLGLTTPFGGPVGTLCAVVFSGVGGAKKYLHMHGKTFFPQTVRNNGPTYFLRKMDVSFFEGLNRNRTKNPPT